MVDKEKTDGKLVQQVDVKAVNSAQTREMYQSRQAIYPKAIKGRFRNLKTGLLLLLLGIYYVLPFLRWDRPGAAPDQFVLVDFPATKLFFGPLELWPQDFYLVSGLLILSAIGLFLASALFGRVWCGYACPQTVWTDLFLFVERLFEGDRNQQIRLNRAPMSFDKAWRKVGKHIIWLIIALATGGWFVAYFHDAFDLAHNFFIGKAPLSAYVFAGLLTFTTYTLAGFMREQVCTYMCPWPRIQGAMLDHDSLSVAYKVDRGEPRGAHKKNESWENRGSCVDCRQCIAVCPTGIDIREGLQIECINCALCIDACDEIMDKIGQPRGLIAYDSAANVEARAKGEAPKLRLIRGRTIFYGFLLILVATVMTTLLALRKPLSLTVIRDRTPLFVTLSDGAVRNGYSLHIVNKSGADQDLTVHISGLSPRSILPQTEDDSTHLMADGRTMSWHVARDETDSLKIFVEAMPDKLDDEKTDINFTIEGTNNIHAHRKSVFLSGEKDEDEEGGEH